MRLCRPARGSTDRVRSGHRAPLLRQDTAARRVVPGIVPPQSPALGSHTGAAVLRADPAAGVAPRRVRAGPGGRPAVGRGDPRLHAATALPDLARRPAGDGGLPRRRRHGVRDRRCSSPVTPAASRRATRSASASPSRARRSSTSPITSSPTTARMRCRTVLGSSRSRRICSSTTPSTRWRSSA